jgi:hypothetical protein
MKRMVGMKKTLNSWVIGMGFALLASSLATGQAADDGDLIRFDPTRMVELKKQLGLSPEFDGVEVSREVGIAIIDDNFGNPDTDKAALPERFEYVNKYTEDHLLRHGLPTNPELYPDLDDLAAPLNVNLSGTKSRTNTSKVLPHGLQLVHAILGTLGRHTPVKFYFLNGAYGFNFAAAAYYAEELYNQGKIRTVVNAGSFSVYGVGNGRGPMDRLVEDVTRDSGLVWINASGNDGGRVWAGQAKRLSQSRYVQFRTDTGGHCLRFKNREYGNKVVVTLLWDGRQRSISEGTDIDYDLEVIDPRGRLIVPGSDELRSSREEVPKGLQGTQWQIAGTIEQTLQDGYSINPQERIVLENVPETENGNYCIRVKSASDRTRETDELQVVIRTQQNTSGDAESAVVSSVEFLDANRVNEMLPPSTAANTISVGNLASYASKSEARLAPSVLMPVDRVDLKDRRWYQGTSFSAPYLAGVKVLLETLYPELTRQDLLRFLKDEPGPVSLDYVRQNLRNGRWMVDQLLALTEIPEARVRAYNYPGDLTVVTLPEFPAKFGKIFGSWFPYERHRDHLDSFEYLFGLRASGVDTLPVPFGFARPIGNAQMRAGSYPWEAGALPAEFVPYDLQQYRTNFEKADFLILEKEYLGAIDEEALYRRPDLRLRQGRVRDQVRKSYWQTPSRKELQTRMQSR